MEAQLNNLLPVSGLYCQSVITIFSIRKTSNCKELRQFKTTKTDTTALMMTLLQSEVTLLLCGDSVSHR